MAPEISIVLPVHNGMRYLKESIQSILNQDFDNWELIICDDASSDGSWDYISSLFDDRIYIFRNSMNKGLFPTLNYLCKKAQSNLIKLWTQDDKMNNNCLSKIIEFHQKYPDIAFSYCDVEQIDEHGNIIPLSFQDFTPEYIPKELHDKIALYAGSVACNISSVTIVKDKLVEVGYFDDSIIIGGDFDMWVRLTAKYNIGRIPDRLIKIRNHSDQLSKSSNFLIYHMKEDLKIYKKLLERVDDKTKKFGLYYLKWNKYPFYFSLMIKCLFEKNYQTAFLFLKEIAKYDNIIILFFRWVSIKVNRRIFNSYKRDNRFLFE